MDTVTTKLTVDNLPTGNMWEEDGAVWQAIKSASAPGGWYWRPMNFKALAKPHPTGEMVDHVPFKKA